MFRILAQVLAFLLVLATVLLAWSEWSGLPERIPTHFNAAGDADAWGSRSTFLIIPVVSVLLYLVLSVVERIPHRHNYPKPLTAENREQVYALSSAMVLQLKVVICASFLYMLWSIVQITRGDATGLPVWFLPVFLALIFSPVLYFFWRMRQIGRATER